MPAHLKHRVLLAALFAVGVTLAACNPSTGPNDSGDTPVVPERKAMPQQTVMPQAKARPQQKVMPQLKAAPQSKAKIQLRVRPQLRAYRAF
jgi:hypothetical protein